MKKLNKSLVIKLEKALDQTIIKEEKIIYLLGKELDRHTVSLISHKFADAFQEVQRLISQ